MHRTTTVVDDLSTTTVDPRRPRGRQVPCRDPKHLWTRTTTVALRTPSHKRHEQLPLPRSREPLLPPRNVNEYRRPQVTRIRQVLLRKTCTTTVASTSTVVVYPYFRYRHENNYFLYELEPLGNAPLEGITTVMMVVYDVE